MSIRPLCPELSLKAKNELFEVPERIPQDLATIKEWLRKQPHINARMDDQWLIAFLRGCKYSLERTKEKLDTFYTMKTAVPEISCCISPRDSDIQELLKMGILLPLLKTQKPDDPTIIIMRPGLMDPSKVPMEKLMCLGQMFANLQMRDDDQTIIAGQIFIIDLKNVGLNMVTHLTPSLMKKAVVSRLDALPMREKGSHYINTPPIAEKIVVLLKSFMKEKNRNRFLVHTGGIEALYEFIPKSILPKEYGGDEGTIQDLIDHWKKKIEDNEDFFVEDFKYKTDESKRPGAPKTLETLFGIEGSFRQLSVD